MMLGFTSPPTQNFKAMDLRNFLFICCSSLSCLPNARFSTVYLNSSQCDIKHGKTLPVSCVAKESKMHNNENNKSLFPLNEVGYMDCETPFISLKDQILREIIYHEISLNNFLQNLSHSPSLFIGLNFIQ